VALGPEKAVLSCSFEFSTPVPFNIWPYLVWARIAN